MMIQLKFLIVMELTNELDVCINEQELKNIKQFEKPNTTLI